MPAAALSPVLLNAKRIVVKVGSSLVTDEGRGLDVEAIGLWCKQLALLVQDGREVIMVSSGAIAEGMKRLGWSNRPKAIHELQAAAAVGRARFTRVIPRICAGRAYFSKTCIDPEQHRKRRTNSI